MADLTPEERQRIYDEEKTRLEARAQIEGKTKAKSKLNSNVGCGTVFLVLGALAVIWYMVNSFSSKTSPPPVTKAAPIATTPPLTVVTNKYSVGEYGYYEVVGEVQNKSSKTFHFVEVKAEFLNAAGAVVGTDMAYACAEDYILPGGKKSFKMMGENQSDYKRVRVFIDDYSEVR